MEAHGYANRLREAVSVLEEVVGYRTIPSELFENMLVRSRGYRVEFEEAAKRRVGMLGTYDGALE
jgi:hypothetical protein